MVHFQRPHVQVRLALKPSGYVQTSSVTTYFLRERDKSKTSFSPLELISEKEKSGKKEEFLLKYRMLQTYNIFQRLKKLE